jgi:aryl-alcohol dehydrogenase-like predicted oxidoreductase
MKKKVLGNTGLEVAQMSLGGGFLAATQTSREEARATMRRATEFGINYIDTAPGYGNSEEVIGWALEGIDEPLTVSTKLGGRPEPFDPQDAEALYGSVEESLRLLRRDQIDILIIHEPDRPLQYDWWTDWESFNGPVLEVMARLKQEGTIRYTGLGGTTAYELAHVINTGRFDVVLTAFNYSLLWREAQIAVIPAATANNMGIIAGSPLQQGALARRYDEQVNHGARWLSPPRREQYKVLYRLLDELDMPIVELAIRFVISNPEISCVLTGSANVQQLEENIAAVEKGPLPADVLVRLDEIHAMVPFRPWEEPFGLPFARDYRGPGRASRG